MFICGDSDTASRIRQAITDAYETCARSAENMGADEVANALRKAAGKVTVKPVVDGYEISYPGVLPKKSG